MPGLHSVKKLADVLQIPPKDLRSLAQTVDKQYKPFDKPKKDGSTRKIDNPSMRLKEVQSRILRRILQPVPLPEFMNGGVPGRSIAHHVAPHVRKPCVVGLDLRDYFNSILPRHVAAIFTQKLGTGSDTTWLLVRLCTLGGRLPQGAPTSTAIANLILAEALEGFRPKSCNLSVWVDDFTISGRDPATAIAEISSRLSRFGLKLNRKKTEIMPDSTQQLATGIVLNRKSSLGKAKRRQIRNELRALEHHEQPLSPRCKGLLVHASAICRSQGARLALGFSGLSSANSLRGIGMPERGD